MSTVSKTTVDTVVVRRRAEKQERTSPCYLNGTIVRDVFVYLWHFVEAQSELPCSKKKEKNNLISCMQFSPSSPPPLPEWFQERWNNSGRTAMIPFLSSGGT